MSRKKIHIKKELTSKVFPFILLKTMRMLFFVYLLNMKNIGFILFIILVYGAPPLFGQLAQEQQTEPVSPSTQEGQVMERDERNTEIASPSTQEEVLDPGEQDSDPTSAELAAENTPDVSTSPQTRWEGKQRILKIVNDYYLKADESITMLVLIAGDARLDGRITGNVLIIGGDVELGQGAQVNGMLQVIGGQITGNLAATKDIRLSERWEIIPAAAKLLMSPHTVWGVNKQNNVRLTIAKFVLFLLTYLLIVVIFPKPINAMSTVLTQRPIGSVLFSILILVAIVLLCVGLTFSIVGIPSLLLGLCLLLPLALFGKAAIFLTLGSTLLAGRLKPLAVIFGYIFYFMATEVPYIDWVTFLIFHVIGIGLCLLSVSRDRDRNAYRSERGLQ